MNLLQLVQQASGEMGIPVPTSVVGSSSSDTQQLLALANAVGMKLQKEMEWEALTAEYRFTTQFTTVTGNTVQGSTTLTLASSPVVDSTYTVLGNGLLVDTSVVSVAGNAVTLNQAATSTTSGTYTFCKTKYALPADYDRMIDRTQWDKSRRWMLVGPQTAAQWQWLKSGWISTGPRTRFRILGGYFQIFPPVAANNIYGYEYYSQNWVLGADGSTKSLFSADTDTCYWPDRLMVAGIKAEYFGVKGFDNSTFMREFMGQQDKAKAMDSPQDTLSMNPSVSQVLLDWNNIPDSGYGGVV
jgi:hypothetical protein